MKIVDNRKDSQFISDVGAGEVFEYEGHIYMKIATPASRHQAVDLSDGTILEFDEDDGVDVLNAELSILPQ